VTCTEENDLNMAIVRHGQPRQVRGFRFSGGDHTSAFTVPELARHYGVAEGTIGRWCSQDRIEGQRDPHNRRRKLYPLQRIQDAYDKRHGAA